MIYDQSSIPCTLFHHCLIIIQTHYFFSSLIYGITLTNFPLNLNILLILKNTRLTEYSIYISFGTQNYHGKLLKLFRSISLKSSSKDFLCLKIPIFATPLGITLFKQKISSSFLSSGSSIFTFKEINK